MSDVDRRIREGLERLGASDGPIRGPALQTLSGRRRRRRVRRAALRTVPVIAVAALALGLVSSMNTDNDDTNVASRNGDVDHATPPATNLDGTPAAELVSPNSRSIDELRQANERIADCMRDEGFEATVDDRGEGVEVTSGRDDQTSVYDAMEKCRSEHGFPEYEYTEEELVLLYEATVRQGECMENVAEVDLSEPPPVEEWIASQGGAWHPPTELEVALRAEGGRDPGIEERAREMCPTPR